MLVAVLLTGSVAAALADATPPAGVPTEDGKRAFAASMVCADAGG
jgi:hypothetical protein